MRIAVKELFALSAPMAITQFVTIGSIFLCMAMLASLGHDVLAASALIYSGRISIIIIGASILFSLSILIGHAFGENEYTRIGNYYQQGLTLAILISIPLMLLFWHIDSILRLAGQPENLIGIVKEFFHANIWNVLPFLFAMCNQQLCYGTRKQRIDLIANMLGAGLVLVLAYGMIFGHFGFPKMGVAGLAYAMSISAWFYFLFTFTVIYKSEYFKRFDLFRYRVHQSWGDLFQMFKVGWPICMQIGGEMLSLFVTAAMFGWLGTSALAAYQVVNQYLFLIIVPLFALAQATGVLVGQSYGAKNYKQIKEFGYVAIIFTTAMTFLVAFIFIAFPTLLAKFYLDINNPANAKTVHFIIILFAIVSFSQILDGIRNVITGALRGLFDTKYPMYVGLGGIWFVGIPLGYVLAFNFHFGPAGIVAGGAVGMFIGAAALMRRWQQKSIGCV